MCRIFALLTWLGVGATRRFRGPALALNKNQSEADPQGGLAAPSVVKAAIGLLMLRRS
jgi:hypothetical protein